jgi:hypothetical protein
MSTNNSFATDRAANAFDNAEFSAVARSPLTTNLPKKASSYAIATPGTFTDNSSSNFAGDLSNPFDDALIFANGAVTLNGTPIFSGFGDALTLGPMGSLQNVSAQLAGSLKLAHLTEAIAIDIPSYLVPTVGAIDRTFDVGQMPLNGAADVARAFSDGLPSVIRVTGGSLNLPSRVVLKNLTIVVESGDLNFNGDEHLLENVTIVVKDGSVNLGNVRAVNSSVYSAGAIHMNQGARFSGKNFLGTKNGDVIFNGATETIDPKDFVKVVAHGDIFLNAGADVRGEFWSSEDFFANGGSTIVGKIRATQSVTFNAPVQIISDGVEYQPLIGIIDTGFNGSNPDIDYSRIILGRDQVDGDDNPLLASGTGNEHGTHILGLIGATQRNGIGIDGVNDQTRIWLGRATGSGSWADSLIEFVDFAKQTMQPHSVINLSFDLVQVNPDGSLTTRYELTPREWKALAYARQHGVLVVVASGNGGGVMSALGQSSQMFDNIITVGSTDGLNRVGYSNYGNGLTVMAPGGTIEHPILSTVDNGLGTLAGTSVSTAFVTGAISQIWTANPNLNYRQIIAVLENSSSDLNTLGWDTETGFGLLNLEKALELAKTTTGQAYQPETFLLPTTWGGDGDVLPLERATNFSGTINDKNAVILNKGLNIRSGPGFSKFPQVKDKNGKEQKISPNSSIEFDLEVQGELVIDPNKKEERSSTWYRLADGRGWVSALYVGNVIQISDQPPESKSSIPQPFYPAWIQNQVVLKNPTSGVNQYSDDTSFMYFEGGSIVNSPLGTFPLYGAIRQEYLRTGGLAGWLGQPKSGEIGQGNGVINQYFANGYIVWNGSKAISYRNGENSPPNSILVQQASFTGWIMPNIGVALRNTPRYTDKNSQAEPYGKWLRFDAWTLGDSVTDYATGEPDNRWFRISGTNNWVPSSYIYGNPEGLPGNQVPLSSDSISNPPDSGNIEPDDKCDELLVGIQKTIEELKNRYDELLEDKLGLQNGYWGKDDPKLRYNNDGSKMLDKNGKQKSFGSIEGHYEQFISKQKNLENRLRSWLDHCGGGNGSALIFDIAYEWIGKTAPVPVYQPPVSIPANAPSNQPVSQPQGTAIDIGQALWGGVLISGGIILIGSTLIEDVGTGGAGTLDDPWTLTAAGKTIEVGWNVLAGAFHF